MTETTDRFRDWDAAYVLGALSTEDRRAFERHLATCSECSGEVAALAGLPGILGKLPVDEAVALIDTPMIDDSHLRDTTHTPGLVQRLAIAASRRRRRVRFGMLAGAVAIVALLAVGGVAYTANQAPTVASVAMSPLHQHVITASLQVTKKGWGTRFDWSCSYPGDSWQGATESYDLVVTEKSGVQTTVATWSTAGPHATGLTASSSIATADIQNVEIRLSGTHKPLLRENL
jgi:hypothetical protein